VPDWTPWLTFFLTALQRQMRRLREKVERERLLLAKLPDLAIQILDHARDHGRVTIADAVAITGASRNTLKLHFKALREWGLLALHGQGRGGLVQPAVAAALLPAKLASGIIELDELALRDFPSKSVSFAEIANFKGLENEAVIPIDLPREAKARRCATDANVGMSRARSLLITVCTGD